MKGKFQFQLKTLDKVGENWQSPVCVLVALLFIL